MRQIFYFILVILSGVAMAANEESTSRFGVQAGANIANANVAPYEAGNNRMGFTVGIDLEDALIPGLLYVQPELNFIQKGAQNTSLGGLGTTTLNYIELPVQAKVKLNIAGVRPYALAGPKIGYLISASSDLPGVSVSRSNFNSLDFGFDVGLGLGFSMTDSTEGFVTARYSWGLVNVASNGSWKNHGLQILAGLLF